MKTIVVKRSDNSELLKVGELIWKKSAKNILVLYYLFLVTGFIFLLMSILITDRGENFWGFGTSFGLALVFSTAFLISSLMHSKKTYFSSLKGQRGARDASGGTAELIFNDDGVKMKDEETYSETKWSYFTRYSVINDYLFLYSSDQDTPLLFVKRNEITDEEFTELKTFLDQTLNQK